MVAPALVQAHLELRARLYPPAEVVPLRKASLLSGLNDAPKADGAPKPRGGGVRGALGRAAGALRGALGRATSRGAGGKGGAAAGGATKAPGQDYHDWHEQYGFHAPHDEKGNATAHASLHLRMAHYHAAHGEHEAAAAHYEAYQHHEHVRTGAAKKNGEKLSNPFKAGKLSDKAWAASAAIHDPKGSDPEPRRQPSPGHVAAGANPAHHGFWAAPGSPEHQRSYAELHARMAQYHQARGDHAAANAHWAASQAHTNGHPHAPGASAHAWSSSAFHHAPPAPEPRAAGGRGGKRDLRAEYLRDRVAKPKPAATGKPKARGPDYGWTRTPQTPRTGNRPTPTPAPARIR